MYTFLEIEYTRHDGSKFHEMGTHVIAKVDGRFGALRATDALIDNARFIASSGDYAAVTLLGVRRQGDYSGRVYPLPDGSRNLKITPMTPDERREYRNNGGYAHP